MKPRQQLTCAEEMWSNWSTSSMEIRNFVIMHQHKCKALPLLITDF